jgi:hypothetical protein
MIIQQSIQTYNTFKENYIRSVCFKLSHAYYTNHYSSQPDIYEQLVLNLAMLHLNYIYTRCLFLQILCLRMKLPFSRIILGL